MAGSVMSELTAATDPLDTERVRALPLRQAVTMNICNLAVALMAVRSVSPAARQYGCDGSRPRGFAGSNRKRSERTLRRERGTSAMCRPTVGSSNT